MRRQDFLPIALVAALPFRIPVSVGGSHANLLLPLYAVIAIGVIKTMIAREEPGAGRTFCGTRPGGMKGLWPSGRVPRETGTWLLPGLLALSVLLYGIQSAYSNDLGQAAKTMGFFLVPFALMFWLLVNAPWTPRLVTVVFGVAVAEMLILALIGAVQHETSHLFWNQEVITANKFQRYFRVNSLFWDPNIFGRYLAIVMVGLAAALLWARERRRAILVMAALAVLWGALALTYSQSSFAALIAGLAVLAALRWSVRWTAIASGVALALALAYLVLFGSSIKFNLGSESGLDRATSGRADLVRGGIELAGRRPVQGFGSGSFVQSFREESKRHVAVAASHTEPITVAAEQGAIGLLVYIALIVSAFATLARGAQTAARAAVLAAFTALFLHTMAYDSFLSDPLSWFLLALGWVLSTHPPTQSTVRA
jgi:O-antigen ligase